MRQWPACTPHRPNHVDSLRDASYASRRSKCGYGGRVTVYAIAALKFTDRDAYNRYQAAFMDVFRRYVSRMGGIF